MQHTQPSWGGEQASPSPPKPFTLVQHNCLGSWDVFLSLFGSFTQLAHPPCIVALQDPPVYRGKLPSFNLFTVFSPPTTGGCKPRVAFYVYSSFLATVSLLPRFFGRGDVMALDLFTPDGFFNPSTTAFTIINSYSTKGSSNNTRSVPPDIIFPSTPLPTLTLGDMNIHHPTADPLRIFKEDEIATSTPYFDRATDLGFSLLNTPGVFTRFSMSLIGRPGVLDLAFACPLLAPYFTEWSDPLPSTGSDHIPILLRFEAPLLRPPPPSPNWALTDWALLEPSLKNMAITPPPPLPTTRSLDIWFRTNLGRVESQFALHTPLKRVTYRSKPWWTELLSMLRKAYGSALHSSKRDRFDASLLASARAARSAYFKAIKKAKSEHWSSFLASATPQSVWTAKKLAIGRPPPRFPELPGASTPPELNKALLDHFFPGEPTNFMDTILLPLRECLPLSKDEIVRALARSSPSSAPGPDMTPNSVWKRVHRVAPHLIQDLLAPLITYGSHPLTLKRADGIVLDKPGKPSYDSPSSFRVIVLLQTFSKILERIMNSRLSSVARASGLLNPHQCGSLAGLSASDAVTTLTHEVKTLQMAGRKVSTLFLDIKGGFDNVNPSSLCGILRAKGVNLYLVSWTRSFLSGRTCRLLYQGSPRVFAPVSVGTPQGSPVSPLLFVIYVSRLHCEIPRGLSLSYVDDFGLTVSSSSYRRNIQALQKQYAKLKTRGSRLGVGFSVPKTELIHWRTARDRDVISNAPVHLDGSVFSPKKEVRWLGYWFTPSIATTPHFVKRLAKAQAAFVAIKRLSPPGIGLPPFLCHRLASSLLFPILSYGADVFVPTSHMLRKLAVFWHKVQRWTTNCFISTPLDILAIEACLPPLDLLLAYKRRLAHLRIMCSPPEINPATARLPPSLQTPSLHRHEPDLRVLSARNAGSRLPLPWLQPRPPSKNRAHLPLDALPHSMLFLLGPDGLDPLPVTSQHLLVDLYPEPPPGRSYPQLKLKCKNLLMEEWDKAAPDPARYPFRPSLRPHPFMGLDKFSAGRLHQMRSGKSYLRAHPSWDSDLPTTCPRCQSAPETFEHAILLCPAREPSRTRHLQGVRDIGPEAPVWSSLALLGALSRFIKSTAMAFPPGMFSRPTSAVSSVSSRSSNVVSFGYFMSS